MTSSMPYPMKCRAAECRSAFVCHSQGRCLADAPAEPGLPLDFAQERPRKEKPAVYEAARALRAAGRTVYRQGAQHSVDGAITSDEQLVALAHALNRTVPA